MDLNFAHQFTENVCNASLFGLTYRFLQYFAVFSANSKDEPRLPSEMIKSQGDTAGDHLQRKLSRENCSNGDEIDTQQTRFCYRVGWRNVLNLLRTDIFYKSSLLSRRLPFKCSRINAIHSYLCTQALIQKSVWYKVRRAAPITDAHIIAVTLLSFASSWRGSLFLRNWMHSSQNSYFSVSGKMGQKAHHDDQFLRKKSTILQCFG